MPQTLQAQPRAEHGKNAARVLRRQGRVPAVVYGAGEQTASVSVDAYELERLLARVNADTTVFELHTDGGAVRRVLIRELQKHPYRPGIVHVDFYQVHAGERIRVDVPVRLIGTPVGVRDSGGVLDQVLYELHVEAAQDAVPQVVEVDVSGLDLDQSVHVSDVTLPGSGRILNDASIAIASVTAPSAGPAGAGPSDSGDAERVTG